MTQERQTIYVAGHRGMVGSAIVRTLLASGVPAQDIITRTHAELDLRNQAAVQAFFQQQRPAQVYLAAAKVGGIHANNTYPADFIYDNLMVQANVIDAAHRVGVQKLLFLGLELHLPPHGRPAHGRRRFAHRRRWSPPTSPTPSPRLPASRCARATTASTGATTAASCRPICMGPATTTTRRTAT